MEEYLWEAAAAGLREVRIVHGKGTGKLRNAVREELKGNTQVERHETGGPTEGGDGVTIAFLAQE